MRPRILTFASAQAAKRKTARKIQPPPAGKKRKIPIRIAFRKAFAQRGQTGASVRRAAKCLPSPRRTPQRRTGFSKSRMPAHETFPRRTQNSRRTAGQRAFPTECAHAKFHSKKRANNAQERRRGGVYCRIRQTPCPAPPECPKKTPAFAVSESGRDGRESGLCAPAKSLNTSICTR